MIPPGFELLAGQPVPQRTGRQTDHRLPVDQLDDDLGQTPAAQGPIVLYGQATRQGRSLRAHLRGKMLGISWTREVFQTLSFHFPSYLNPDLIIHHSTIVLPE
jgi:hypothetical protein